MHAPPSEVPWQSCRPAPRAAAAAGHAPHAAAGRRRVTRVRDEVKIFTRRAHITHAEDDHRATHARQQRRGSTPRAVGTRAQPWRRPAGRHHRTGGFRHPRPGPRGGISHGFEKFGRSTRSSQMRREAGDGTFHAGNHLRERFCDRFSADDPRFTKGDVQSKLKI